MTDSLDNEKSQTQFACSTSVQRVGNIADSVLDPKVTSILAERRQQFLRHLQHRLGDRDTAEDVLQDFHMKVLSKAKQIRTASSTVSWLRTVLNSVLMDHFRHTTAERHAHQQMVADSLAITAGQDMTTAEDGAVDREACTCLYQILPTLKTEYADVLSRVDIAQQSRADVALALGITTGNVRVRLYRARQALKEALERSCTHCHKHDCFRNDKRSERVD